ncbi:MAG TPA: Lpg1974 family pore-forming outer membrane protein [Gemmataceae bacterium]|nr:Lpg1974 family pore-forming outer membrane protein [Gemmataceae bacterium]
MASLFRLLVVLAVWGALAPCGSAQAQTPTAAPPAAIPGTSAEPDILPGFPRPPDAPRSLLQAPPAAAAYFCDALPGPYFERDPRLDPPPLPPPGWFADLDIGIVAAHVKNRLTELVTLPGRTPDTVHIGSAELNWAASPRFEVGRRLPSGFGEFSIAYRFFSTEGSGLSPAPDGLAALKSRLDVNVGDLDYSSRELSLLPHWGMKWRFGIRAVGAFFDSRSAEPVAVATAGSGVFERQTSNNFWGFGPHMGLELARRWEESGLAFVGRVDGATILGRLEQHFFEETTPIGPTGEVLAAGTNDRASQDVPMLTWSLGLSWQPPGWPDAQLFFGYEYEYWWNVGRNSNTTARGELSDQGILLRAEFNF